MTIDLDEAKDRAERGLLLTARHGEALLAELKRLREELRLYEGGTKLLERQISSCYVDALREIEQLKLRLRIYDKREQSVQELARFVVDELVTEKTYTSFDEDLRDAKEQARAVRDFKVQQS